MVELVGAPTRIEAASNMPMVIDEYFGLVNTNESDVSVTRMRSPGHWHEPGQCPDFHEYIVVLRGTLHVEHERGTMDVEAGQGLHAHPGEWVRYSAPLDDGVEYITICTPAFTRATVYRDV